MGFKMSRCSQEVSLRQSKRSSMKLVFSSILIIYEFDELPTNEAGATIGDDRWTHDSNFALNAGDHIAQNERRSVRSAALLSCLMVL